MSHPFTFSACLLQSYLLFSGLIEFSPSSGWTHQSELSPAYPPQAS